MTDPHTDYLADYVQAHDRDRYLLAMFAPAERRAGMLALIAFNHEVAKTREQVSEPAIGLIRLQWWREAVDEIFADGPVRQHPVVQALVRARHGHGQTWQATWFHRLIDARQQELDAQAMADLPALESYANDTTLPLNMLLSQPLDGGFCHEKSSLAIEQIGTAYALAGLMRAVGYHLRERRVLLPDDLLAQHDLDAGRVADFPSSASLRPVVRAVCERATALLAEARQQRHTVSRAALPVTLSAVLATQQLRRLAAGGHDPLSASAVADDPLSALRLSWAALTGRW